MSDCPVYCDHDDHEKVVHVSASELTRLREENESLKRMLAGTQYRSKGLEVENAKLRETLEFIAAPKRPDGTYNRSREACEQLAKDALEKLGETYP